MRTPDCPDADSFSVATSNFCAFAAEARASRANRLFTMGFILSLDTEPEPIVPPFIVSVVLFQNDCPNGSVALKRINLWLK